jgi:hypothetical protein
LGYLSKNLDPLAHRQAHRGDEGTHSEHRTCNLHRSGCNDREGCSLNLEGPRCKVFRSNVCDVCFLKRFRAPNNVVKYNGKTNHNVWLEDYHPTCMAGGVDDDLFII